MCVTLMHYLHSQTSSVKNVCPSVKNSTLSINDGLVEVETVEVEGHRGQHPSPAVGRQQLRVVERVALDVVADARADPPLCAGGAIMIARGSGEGGRGVEPRVA